MKIYKNKMFFLLSLIIIFALINSGCSKSGIPSTTTELTGTVSSSGSTALLPIVKQAATDFMNKNNKITISVAGGGSGTGLEQAKNGTVNIGNSDVFAASDSGLVDHQIAIEPFAFVVNNNVKVTSLTKEQLIGIFSGDIKNWKEVGGVDAKIAVIMRQASSGTRLTIQKEVMGNKNFTTSAVVGESSKAVKATVESTPNSIGYLDFAYIDSTLKAISYNGIAPTIDNVKNGKYTLTSIGHMYTKGEATGAAKAFIEYIKNPSFQDSILPKYKFIPMKR